MTEPEEILRDAERIANVPASTRDEPRRRTILSRAYYAAYHHVRRSFAPAAMTTGPGGMRRRYLTWLAGSGDEEMVRVGRILDRLYRRRLHADYDLRRPVQIGGELRVIADVRNLMARRLPEAPGQ